jgi:hypothetical protein
MDEGKGMRNGLELVVRRATKNKNLCLQIMNIRII